MTGCILVRGAGDVGSAVAAALFRAGYRVAIHEEPMPTSLRRGMAFTDAVFDGSAILDGLLGTRADGLPELHALIAEGVAIPLTIDPFAAVLSALPWAVIIDARMRKRAVPERQSGIAPLTIGLGPNFVAGQTVDLAIETQWGDRLGAVVEQGPTSPLGGEPRAIGGIGRERFVYAETGGRLESEAQIGDLVAQGSEIARIGKVPLLAPVAGVIRGLVRSGVDVVPGTKVLEVDPRGDRRAAFGLGERPKRIAEGVLHALRRAEKRAA